MELILTNVYIERCDKDTEDVITKEEASFLNTPLKQLKQNPNEFIYIESPTFEPIKVDALSLELDDIFQTYMVLLGLKVQKKYAKTIKTFLNNNLHGTNVFYNCMFSGEDGLWDLNIPLDFMDGFREEVTIAEALSITYSFLEALVNTFEQQPLE